MKEAYAVRRTVPPSAELEEQIDRLLAARLLAAHLLKRVTGAHADELVGSGEAREQLSQARSVRQHDGYDLFRATERVGMAAAQDRRERLLHGGEDRTHARQ